MDILSISNPNNFPIPTFCNPKTLNTKFAPNHKKLTSPFHRNPFSLCLSTSTTTKFRTWAHFGRTTGRRRNSLRKKLLHDHQVRRPNQIPNDPSSVSGNPMEESGLGIQTVSVVDNVVEVEKPKSKLLGESVLLNKLENWVDQYKKDIGYWGIGSGPIFTVYQDSIGGVKRVSVDEEEILRRSRVQREVIEDFPEVNRKILNAKSLAREMEIGNNVIPRNSSVAKFVIQGEEERGFVNAIRGFVDQPGLLLRLSRVGSKVLYVFVVLWAVKKLFGFGEKEVQHTEMEKEMMRRKIKARKEKGMLKKGAVEVIPQPLETLVVDIKKPKLDKEQLRKNILKAKGSPDKLVVQNSSTKVSASSMGMEYKVQEIREMARRARKMEARDHSLVSRDMEMDDPVIETPSNKIEDIEKNSEQHNNFGNHQNEVEGKTIDGIPIPQTPSVDVMEKFDNSVLQKVASADECNLYASDVLVPGDKEINNQETEFTENVVHLKNEEENKPLNTPINGSSQTNESSVNKKPRIIRSVKEARDYLSKKHDKQVPVMGSKIEHVKEKFAGLKSSTAIDFNDQKCQNPEMNTAVPGSDTLNGISHLMPAVNASKVSNQKDKELDTVITEDSCVGPGLEYLQKPEATSDCEVNGETRLSVKTENPPGRNVLEFEPINEQIRGDDLNGISDFKPALNPSEDSNKKDKEFSATKDHYFKDSGVEPRVGELLKSENTVVGKVNSLNTETKLSGKAEDRVEENFHEVEPTIEQIRSDSLNGISDSKSAINLSEDSDPENKEVGLTKDDYFKDSGVLPGVGDLKKSKTTSDGKVNGFSTKAKLSGKTENWLENNFHEVEPIIKQIRAGFRNNYMVAKERVDQPLDIPTEMESLGVVEDGGELDWMQDDHLRDIVFRVRENELSGRDPFYLINAEDKDAFFRGLEKKVEKENKKLSYLHEWLHSNIENLDYGADGISIYDPPEKIIPRWKGPPVEKIPQFLNEFFEKRKVNFTRNINPVKKDENGFAEKSDDSSLQERVDGSVAPPDKKLKNSKTVIEASDGSVKAGKKSGKEYWQHTKKWSHGFLQSYNAETDPEIKSVMKDIGKDLDRWITEKEIQEAADLMNKLPDRNRNIMEKKLNKLKREMELFGPQAVVTKYREYADDKEEDYLWWLDLSHVLCIELYTIDDGKERVGLYSLEMAADLELEPKPYHVIAFQDGSDCKNLCYIIQAHLDMLGKGNAFVIARPPKDAFREAKANGFGVTVIKKGELQLNIDQPLEEVEEQITEIGSKIYHDMMMKERSVDINSLMKGVFGFSDSTTKRLKRKLKKPRKG